MFKRVVLFLGGYLTVLTATAYDGRAGANAYDQTLCYAQYYNQCVSQFCLNSPMRDCKESICQPLAADKCRYEDLYPRESKRQLQFYLYK